MMGMPMGGMSGGGYGAAPPMDPAPMQPMVMFSAPAAAK